MTLEVQPGEKLGIVGASGAGKSTLVALLLRLYDTEAGSIKVDGQDVRGVTQESLRRNIGLVTQETAMFNRSARSNILYGDPEPQTTTSLRPQKRPRHMTSFWTSRTIMVAPGMKRIWANAV